MTQTRQRLPLVQYWGEGGWIQALGAEMMEGVGGNEVAVFERML